MIPDDPPGPAAWSSLSQGISVALWTSFLVACAETMIVFAFLDPATLDNGTITPTLAPLRPLLYGCGFFVFWSFSFIAAGLTAYMMQTGPRTTSRTSDGALKS